MVAGCRAWEGPLNVNPSAMSGLPVQYRSRRPVDGPSSTRSAPPAHRPVAAPCGRRGVASGLRVTLPFQVKGILPRIPHLAIMKGA